MASCVDNEVSTPSITLALTPAGNEMYNRYSDGDYERALHLAEEVLAADPGDPFAGAVRTACKSHVDLCAEFDIEIDVEFDEPQVA
jgi:hypothetical protein